MAAAIRKGKSLVRRSVQNYRYDGCRKPGRWLLQNTRDMSSLQEARKKVKGMN